MTSGAKLAVLFVSLSAIACLAPGCKEQQKRDVLLATTTSTQDSGLLDVLAPMFEKKAGCKVKTIAVGSGQALTMGRRGEADVLLVHAPTEEEKFMSEGHGIERHSFMYNDFVLVGPAGDPAGLGTAASTAELLKKVAESQTIFVSRGDNSGTHMLEKKLWKKAGVEPKGAWYQEVGQGMGQALIIAAEKQAYTLSDRGTFLSMRDKLKSQIVFQGDPSLKNTYSVILVNPKKSEKINSGGAREFMEFLLSQETLDVIKSFGIDKFGEPLFHLLAK